MRDFEFYISSGKVRKVSPDYSLSQSLLKSSQDRLRYALSQDIEESNSKYIFEEAYEALRECIDAILAKDGYKTESHEAAISYLLKVGTNKLLRSEIERIDGMRGIRIGTKYYGKGASVPVAKEALEFSKAVMPKIAALAKN